MKDRSSKTRRKIDKLLRKGKITEAIELQLRLCRDPHPSQDELLQRWSELAEIALTNDRPQLELSARFNVAKLEGAGPAVWQHLAEQARIRKLDEEQIIALFRAADAAARLGMCDLALELCDKTLKLDPAHESALSIRGIMSARLTRVEARDPSGTDKGAKLIEKQQKWAAQLREEAAANIEQLISKATLPDELPDHGALIDQSNSQWFSAAEWSCEYDLTPVKTVNADLRWPTVLDRQSLLFTGPCDEIDSSLLSLATPKTYEAGASICSQGRTGELLYCLDEGEAHAYRERGYQIQDLGAINSGAFFGEVGAHSSLPCSVSVLASLPCKLKVISRGEIVRRLEKGDATAEKAVNALRTWYFEKAISICLPFQQEVQHLLDISRSVIFQPGDDLARQGQSGALLLLISGMAGVTLCSDRGDMALGHLWPGDLVGELDPSPVMVTAECSIFALAIEREGVKQLPRSIREVFEDRTSTSSLAVRALMRHPRS